MRLVDAALPWFARHETFHPRYGWFRKAYTETARDPHVFGRDNAPVVIGVGKNMVRAIRFWGLAAKLITNDAAIPKPQSTGVHADLERPRPLRRAGMGSLHGGPWHPVAASLAPSRAALKLAGVVVDLQRVRRRGVRRRRPRSRTRSPTRSCRRMEDSPPVVGEERSWGVSPDICAGGTIRSRRLRRSLGLSSSRAESAPSLACDRTVSVHPRVEAHPAGRRSWRTPPWTT